MQTSSPLSDIYQPVVPVVSLVNITRNVPICLPIKHAIQMERFGKGALSRDQWKDVILMLLDIAEKLFDCQMLHGDFHTGNFLIVFLEGNLKISVIDFGNASEAAECSEDFFVYQDLHDAMEIIRNIATNLQMENTRDFAKEYKNRLKEFDEYNNFAKVRKVLLDKLADDASAISSSDTE